MLRHAAVRAMPGVLPGFPGEKDGGMWDLPGLNRDHNLRAGGRVNPPSAGKRTQITGLGLLDVRDTCRRTPWRAGPVQAGGGGWNSYGFKAPAVQGSCGAGGQKALLPRGAPEGEEREEHQGKKGGQS